MQFASIFAPGKIGTLKTKNRLVMPPMVRNYADKNGFATTRYIKHIESIARGGVGLMILEASLISQNGRGFVNELGIDSDAIIPGLKKLVAAAHKYGAAIGPQIYHAGRQTNSHNTGMQPVAPSPIPDVLMQEMPHELTEQEIADLVAAYAAAADRAKRAGCDFVEIHGAHGYLITQFLSPFSNTRTDKYGGSKENRERFLQEVFAAVRSAVGDYFPIIVRLSGEEMVKGGLTLKDTIAIAKNLEHAGANALHISVGNYASYAKGFMIAPMSQPDGLLVPLAAAISKAVKIPVITVGKIRTPQMAERILKNKEASYIGIGRTLLADPEWPNKVKKGRLDEINPCIACNQGCITRLFSQKDVWCTTNPACGHEERFEKKAKAKKRVIIVGGGPAGMEAAIVAARRGHKVVLLEKNSAVGGQLRTAMMLPLRSGWKELVKAKTHELARLKVDVRTRTLATAELVRKFKPDAIIYAAGSIQNLPPIQGINLPHVFGMRDALNNPKKVKGAVTIIGGGCSGAETAEFFAMRGHKVSIIEMKPDIALGAPVDDRALLLERLAKYKVAVHTNTKLDSIESQTVTYETAETKKTLKADSVIICLGSKPTKDFAKEFKGLSKKLILVGDANAPLQVTEAIAEGAFAALHI